ncbi:hypothetical protein N8T08_000322 [Aspergillus melleus]|uniref:Uncharacterized protein n=1 Tax=Aspergillus melleus TaxID=138277 RepID=A0ACC3BBB5_9EURO|nr:hypothetical protein N8T08_000322 [Aspergillus melleus]
MEAETVPVGKRKPGMTANFDIAEPPIDDESEDISRSRLFIARPTWSVAPHNANGGHQNWNKPRSNIWKTLATFWSFFVMGANDSASGPLLPYLQSYYKLSYTVVSVIFLSPLIGYAIAGVIDGKIYTTMGRRGVALICPLCHLLAYIINSFHPPYHALVIALTFAGVANGLSDSAWNAWVGSMDNASQLLGILHAFFGLGAVFGPLIISSLVAQAGHPWYFFYYVMSAFSFVELITSLAAFWDMKGELSQYQEPGQPGKAGSSGGTRKAMFQRPFARVTWLCSMFFLVYVGVEVAIGGWVVTFMKEVRNAAEYASSMTATGFWLGLSVGRLVLGFITPLIGEKIAILTYITLQIVFCLVVYLVPNFYVAAVGVAMQGFFLGPLFPAVVYACVKLLPEDLHVTVIGVTTGFSSIAVYTGIVGCAHDSVGLSAEDSEDVEELEEEDASF